MELWKFASAHSYVLYFDRQSLTLALTQGEGSTGERGLDARLGRSQEAIFERWQI